MEISVHCPCGTKYKFDVEPVYGRMPAPVSCPACGADGTTLANQSIRATLAGGSPAAPTPVPTPVPIPVPMPGASAPPPLSAARLRVSSPAPSAAPSPAAEPSFSEPYAPGPGPGYPTPSITVIPAKQQSKSKRSLGVITVLVVVACIAFGTWHVASKWYKRIQSFAEIAKSVGDAAQTEFNFMGDDSASLYIKHTNHLEVAEACKEYWTSHVKKSILILEKVHDEEYGEGQYELWKEHNGYVQFVGGLDWPVEQNEGLAEFLSKRFGTIVLEVRSEEDTEAYHFGVYDQGTRKFHAQAVMDKEFDLKVTTEGNDWAKANGFKPGETGFKEFDLFDADKIAQHLGLKMWDALEDEQRTSIWLQEVGRKRTPKPEPTVRPAMDVELP